MSEPLRVEVVENPQQMRDFIRLPERIYKNDPNYVPPLRSSVEEKLDPDKNTFFQRGRAALFLACRGNRLVGRISAQVYDEHIAHHLDGTGHFGFLVAEDDAAVVAALFRAAEDWARGQGLVRLTGPYSLKFHDQCGILIDGFDTPPALMMEHNPAYLQALVEACGYSKVRDLFAYRFENYGTPPPKLARVARMQKQVDGLKVRMIDMKNYPEEAKGVFELFNDAWQDNWGFVPLPEDEVASTTQKLKAIIDPKMTLIAEIHGRPVGMVVMVPDLNYAMRDVGPNPSWFGWLKILYRLKFQRIKFARVIMGGVRHEFRKTPRSLVIFAALVSSLFEINRHRIRGSIEMGAILEDNADMLSWMRAVEAKRAKTYRVYEKRLVEDYASTDSFSNPE